MAFVMINKKRRNFYDGISTILSCILILVVLLILLRLFVQLLLLLGYPASQQTANQLLTLPQLLLQHCVLLQNVLLLLHHVLQQ